MMRCVAAALTIVLAAAAAAEDIGFEERFALAADRSEALRDLVPGTDEFFYYHALHAQNTGQRDVFQETIDRWIRERKGVTADQARELLNRQALLDYDRFPDRTRAYLRDQLRPALAHVRPEGGERLGLPTKLDATLFATDTLLERALADDRTSLARIEDAGLELAAARPLTADQRRSLLARLRRPDFPGLVELIVADLDHDGSRGFGHHEIHGRLTRPQLDALLERKPDLRDHEAFVRAVLATLVPEDEVDLETDVAARQAYLERLWAFVQTLGPVHNSLKANVLHGRLLHDRQQGAPDAARFLEYLRLPRDVPHLPDAIRARLPRGDHLARLDRSFDLPLLPPVIDEEPLVRDYLLELLAAAPDPAAYAPWIDADFLRRIFAEAKITAGAGDPRHWAALLTPDEYRRIKDRVDIDWAASNPTVRAAGDAVRLTAFVKNVSSLLVKVYEIDALNLCRETGRSPTLAIDLDGLVASTERRIDVSAPPERRVARVLELPELAHRGVYVVELVGNGIRSRALVQKGRLGVIEEVTAAGHAFTVCDEAGRPVADARGWLAGREFTPDARGRLVVPFSTDPGDATLVVHQGACAVPVRFRHRAEAYDLDAGVYVDREALLRGARATLAVRPVLRVCGRPTSLALLEDPRLTIRVTDLRGVVTEQEIPGLALRDDAESLAEFAVPEAAAAVAVTRSPARRP